ncbi:MAG: hypothetical protein NVS3B3_23080 [Aquirhabdus sp.]
MARTRDSILLGWQRDGLRIDQFIFHIIAPDDPNAEEGVIPLDEVELSGSQQAFFLERLKDTAEGNKYLFLTDAVTLKDKCVALATLGSDFITISRQITSDFATRHKANMSPGVFVIAEVSVPMGNDQLGKLVFLVKLDHKKSLNVTYKEVDGVRKAVMVDLPNTLTESKSAVQKSALIDVHNGFNWDVLAWDRNGTERPTKLSDYFEGFLGVGIHGTPAALTQTAIKTVRTWITSLDAADLPDGLDKVVAKERALDYLKGSAEFDTVAFINSIIRDEDPVRRTKLNQGLLDALGETGVAGQKFATELSSLSKSQRKTTYRADEGVNIISQDGAGQAIIEIEWADKAKKSGAASITITTRNLTIDG